MKKAIIFDYDGVLVDSSTELYDIYKVIFDEVNAKIKPKTIEEFRKLYGLTYSELRENTGIEEKDYDKVSEIYKRELDKTKPKAFPEIKEILNQLKKKYKLAVVSSNYEEHVKENLKTLDLLQLFDLVVGYKKHGEENTPAQKHILLPQAINELGLKNEEVIFVGDREIDYIEAKKAEINDIILVSYGWDSEEKLKRQNPEVMINTPGELIPTIKSLDI